MIADAQCPVLNRTYKWVPMNRNFDNTTEDDSSNAAKPQKNHCTF